jgi:acetylornithine deacetylase
VLQTIEHTWPQQVSYLQSLVQEPSTLGNEAGVQRIMQATFREMGLTVHTFEPDIGALSRLRGFSPPEWSYRGRPNVVGIWPAGGSGGRSLVLNSHVDVVSPEPVSHWSYDPWGAQIVGDRMYGRGACDMKSGVSAMVYAVRAIQATGIRLKGDVILQSVIEEECTGNGALACLERGFTGDGCLIPEPSYGKALVAQVGVLWGRIKVRGRAAHVSGANRAINAIEKTYVLIQAMRELEAQLNRQKHPAFQEVEWPINFNPGIIHAGDWNSTVPSECILEFRMGFYPDMSAAEAKTMVRQHLLEAAARDPWLKDNLPDSTFFGFHAEGTAINFAESPVIQVLNTSHQEVLGQPLLPSASTGTTDTRFFLLYYDIPATCYGARGENSHGIDEYVELPTLLEATKVIAVFIMDWCGVMA